MHHTENTKSTIIQVKQIIQTLTVEEYTKPLDILTGSSVGQHFRHILEFYIELCEGCQDGSICYDNRKRNIDFEQIPNMVVQKLDQIFLEGW